MAFENKDQPQNTIKVDHNLKPQKVIKLNKAKKVVKMVSIALDGYGNRVFVSEEKSESIKKKLGL